MLNCLTYFSGKSARMIGEIRREIVEREIEFFSEFPKNSLKKLLNKITKKFIKQFTKTDFLFRRNCASFLFKIQCTVDYIQERHRTSVTEVTTLAHS